MSFEQKRWPRSGISTLLLGAAFLFTGIAVLPMLGYRAATLPPEETASWPGLAAAIFAYLVMIVFTLGTVVAGFGTDLFGARVTLATMAVALLVLALLVSRRTLARPRATADAPARA